MDISKVAYSDPKIIPNGGRLINISYKNLPDGCDRTVYVQTPYMMTPFGFDDTSKFATNNGGSESASRKGTKHTISISFSDIDTNEKMQQMHAFITAFDDQVEKDAIENYCAWFKRAKMDRKPTYMPTVKTSEKYPPNMKISMFDKEVSVSIFEEGKPEVASSVEAIKDNMKFGFIKAIISPTIYITAGTNIGVTWRAKKVIVKLRTNEPLRFLPTQDTGGADMYDDDDDDQNID